ncbi:MAG: barstar family protein [Solobacterium sp.]|nr:barstar family protein [Solobacterium sp.]MBQ6356079.1 barstar family protein [Solobacterium sp.]MBQ6533528.1 barstar family protein [Solobacterium sp.]MBR0215082.1 barstar family protein [Solobacterium sp.]
MSRRIKINASRMQTRDDIHDYMEDIFDFQDYYGRNLDALYDRLQEVTDDIDLVFTHDAIAGILDVPYAYRTLMVLGKACDENPHLHILFRP